MFFIFKKLEETTFEFVQNVVTVVSQLAQQRCDNVVITSWLTLSQRCGKVKNESCGDVSFRRCDNVVVRRC